MFRFKRQALTLGTVACIMLARPSFGEVTPEQSQQITATMLAEIVKIHGQPKPLDSEQTVAQVFHTLAQHADRNSSLNYRVSVVESDSINAYALPDGQVVVYSGLLSALPQDDLNPLAFVLAHEISHVENHHAERKAENMMTTNIATGILILLVGRTTGQNNANWAGLVGGIGSNLITSGYSRDMEAEADGKAMELLCKAGYEPDGSLTVFRLFQKAHENNGGLAIFPTHPDPTDRYKDAFAWIDENRPSPAVALAGLGPGFDKELEDIEVVASSSARTELVSPTRSMRGSLTGSNFAGESTNFDSLLKARGSVRTTDPLSQKLGSLENRFLYEKARVCEALAQYLWAKVQNIPVQPGAADAPARQSFVDLISACQAIRLGLEQNKNDIASLRGDFEQRAADWEARLPLLGLDDARFGPMKSRLTQELRFLGHAWIRFSNQGVPVALQPAIAGSIPAVPVKGHSLSADSVQALNGKLLVEGCEIPLPEGSYWQVGGFSALPGTALAVTYPIGSGGQAGCFYTWNSSRQGLELQDLAVSSTPARPGQSPQETLNRLARRVASGETPTALVQRLSRAARVGDEWRALIDNDPDNVRAWLLKEELVPVGPGSEPETVMYCARTANSRHRPVLITFAGDYRRIAKVRSVEPKESACPGCHFDYLVGKFSQSVKAQDKARLQRLLAPTVRVMVEAKPPKSFSSGQLTSQICSKGWLFRQLATDKGWSAAFNSHGQICGLTAGLQQMPPGPWAPESGPPVSKHKPAPPVAASKYQPALPMPAAEPRPTTPVTALVSRTSMPNPPAPPTVVSDKITVGSSLSENSCIESPNGMYRFVCQTDGNCIVYRMGEQRPRQLWQTNTLGQGCRLALEPGGLMCVRDHNGASLWYSRGDVDDTLSNYQLQMQDDGNLVIYRRTGDSFVVVWASKREGAGFNPH